MVARRSSVSNLFRSSESPPTSLEVLYPCRDRPWPPLPELDRSFADDDAMRLKKTPDEELTDRAGLFLREHRLNPSSRIAGAEVLLAGRKRSESR